MTSYPVALCSATVDVLLYVSICCLLLSCEDVGYEVPTCIATYYVAKFFGVWMSSPECFLVAPIMCSCYYGPLCVICDVEVCGVYAVSCLFIMCICITNTHHKPLHHRSNRGAHNNKNT
jgi:hypothetical protein